MYVFHIIHFCVSVLLVYDYVPRPCPRPHRAPSGRRGAKCPEAWSQLSPVPPGAGGGARRPPVLCLCHSLCRAKADPGRGVSPRERTYVSQCCAQCVHFTSLRRHRTSTRSRWHSSTSKARLQRSLCAVTFQKREGEL